MPFRVAPKSGDEALEVGVDGVEDAAEWGGVSRICFIIYPQKIDQKVGSRQR